MNGIIVVDKPSGKTSFDIVRDIRGILKIDKAGHTGTLDPLATGVLPVCINEATKLVRFFSQDDKEYEVIMLLGIETDTLDIEGKIVARHEPDVRLTDVEKVIESFAGKIEQKPPKYSAIKYKGKALYRWMREGVDVDPPARTIEIYKVAVKDVTLPYVMFDVSCSKGTYVRSLCADMGAKLGCGACMFALRRKKSGNFAEEEAVSLGGLDKRQKQKILKENLISMVDALPDFLPIPVDQTLAERIRKGYQPETEILNGNDNISSLNKGDLIKFLTADDNIVAIGKMLFSSKELSSLHNKEQAVKIVRVFNR
ncbi:MAG: tRNA pseudouridine(55) synthase TruB [Desulfobacteraceae bacterium 4484_190.3]|nr:MAG: tRNA pseudouridine(55) synthase TruB [Desulfobacteraceae bacterium 4484_190.3]